jgi:hypothetical protein
MKIIQQLRLHNGEVVTADDPLKDLNGNEVRVQMSPEDPTIYPVVLSCICFVPQLEITDSDDDIVSTPAHYQLLYWIINPSKKPGDDDFQGLPFGDVDIIWAKDVVRVREKWLQAEVAQATAEWFNNDDEEEEEGPEEKPANGATAPVGQTATT